MRGVCWCHGRCTHTCKSRATVLHGHRLEQCRVVTGQRCDECARSSWRGRAGGRRKQFLVIRSTWSKFECSRIRRPFPVSKWLYRKRSRTKAQEDFLKAWVHRWLWQDTQMQPSLHFTTYRNGLWRRGSTSRSASWVCRKSVLCPGFLHRGTAFVCAPLM